MNDAELDDALRAWADAYRTGSPAIAVPHDRLGEPSDHQDAHRRRWAAGASAAAVLAAAGVIVAVQSAGSGSPGARPADSGTTGSAAPKATSYADLVVRDGDRVTASGQVVAVAGRKPRLCAPRSDDLIGGTGPRTVEWCAAGVDLIGVDLSKLAGRYAYHGSVEGNARVTGTLHAGTLTVTAQEPPSSDQTSPQFENPPCPAPAGGWPIGGPGNLDSTPAEDYAHEHPGTVFEFALLRPGRRQVVAYVLTTGAPAPVDAALRPHYGSRLCVFRSRYTRAEVNAARRPFDQWMQRSTAGAPAVVTAPAIVAVGEGLSVTSQAAVDVQLDWVTPELAAIAGRQPAGLVQLQPWLRPIP
jgi:hypothetical protein